MPERESKRGEIPLTEDITPIGYDSQGNIIRVSAVAQIFEKRRGDASHQVRLATRSIERYCIQPQFRYRTPIKPDVIIGMITEEEAKNEVRIWCKGKNVKLKEEEIQDNEAKNSRSKKLLGEDSDLIKKLSPHLRPMDLARILVLNRYRDADPETQQTLVFGTYRLLSDVLGPRRFYRRDMPTATPISLPDLPIEIFENEFTRTVLLESEREATVPIFNDIGYDKGFQFLRKRKAQVDDPLLKGFIESLEQHWEGVQNLNVPGFKNKIAGSQKDVPNKEEIEYSIFPTAHQKEYAYRFINKPIGKVDLLIGDTATMKTKASIYAMEAAGSKCTIVVCPSGINKLAWEEEIREAYDHDIEIKTINSAEDLRKMVNSDTNSNKPRYIIIGYQLLSRFGALEWQEISKKMKEKIGADSLVADEVHLAKEPDAECTQQLYVLSHALSKDAPRIAMTATGIVNTVEDLDAPVRILLPYKYQNRGDFTMSARNDPHFVSALLYGQQLLTRWAADDILRNKLPEVREHDEPIPLSPFHQLVYEYVYRDDTIEAQSSRGMLRQVSLDPQLIRHHYNPDSLQKMIDNLRQKLSIRQDDREREIMEERIKALEERMNAVNNLSNYDDASKDLLEAYDKFILWKLDDTIKDNNEVFNEDFLVKMGYGRLVLWAFFKLPDGVDEIVKKSNNKMLEMDWDGKRKKGTYSSKSERLFEILDQSHAAGDEKVIISSGFYQSNVTSGIEDTDPDDEYAFFSLYDHLRSRYGYNKIRKIDGKVGIEPKRGELAEREQVRREFRLDPNKWLLATSRSSRLGINLSIPPTNDNAGIKRVKLIILDFPDTHADVKQVLGRVRRPGQKIPIEVLYFKATNIEQPKTVRYGFIDHGMWEALEFKRLLSQMVLDGVPLTEEEDHFVRAHFTNLRTELYPVTPQTHLVEKFYSDIRGKGAKKNLEYLAQVGFEGLTNAELFVNYYPKDDEVSLAGHNARGVTEVIRRYKEISGKDEIRIGSAGSGAGILQEMLGESVVNIDMLPEILQYARLRHKNRGDFIVGDASHLPIRSESFDVLDASFVLHWSSNQAQKSDDGQTTSERTQILKEINSVTKMNGLVTITLPSTYLSREQFIKWKKTLENYFGLKEIEDLPSGLLRATDYKSEPISWIFNLQKVGEPKDGFSIHDLQLDFEKIVDIINPTRRSREKGDITLSPPIPHSEFEIVKVEDGERKKLKYEYPASTVNIEEELLGEQRSAIDALAELGTEEFGLYSRLVRYVEKMGYSKQDAETISFNAINEWDKAGTQRHDINKIWHELQVIVEDLKERRQ